MSNPTESRRRFLYGSIVLLVILAIGISVVMRRSASQLAADDEVFRAVDALFTALTSRDLRRLDDCALRLDELYDADRVSAEATDFLDSVIEGARAGKWEPAAKRLYDFMLAQQRR